jgi:hypothetical protein
VSRNAGVITRFVFVLTIATSCSVPVSAGAQTLRIFHIDVEQGDAALVVMPNGKTLLIDSGKNGHAGIESAP